MKTTIVTGIDPFSAALAGPQLHALPRKARFVLSLLSRMEHGSLRLVLPDGHNLSFGRGEPRATIALNDLTVFDSTLKSGDVGFAEAYIRGGWRTESLYAVLDLMVANRRVLEEVVYGSVWGRTLYRLRHLFNRNSKAGSRRNIAAHYDLGNAFYAMWLDPTMTYSSALFDGDAARTLEQAQHAKYARVLSQLRAGPGSRLLEIGCGWGGLAEQAARAGATLTGLTLSREQHAFGVERLRAAGLGDRAQLVIRDYRDEDGRYDGVASIEMFEAVGEAYWPAYFETLARTLAPGGRAVVQTITIDDALFERYRAGTDFIQQYVFPGGMLPSPSRFCAAAEKAGLRVTDRFAFGTDYARTLKLWREQFMQRLDAVRAQGFDDEFIRLWEFYLAYCEAAFAHRNTDVIQFTLEHS